MSDHDLFQDEQHATSLRYAIFEDDGTSAWMYLTEPDLPKPIGDAWVYNRVAAPATADIESFRNGPPPAAEGFASKSARCASPEDYEWTFLWSADGDAVALCKDGEPVAMIVAGKQGGFSRELIKDGPWGHPWSDKVFEQTFEAT